MQRDQPATRSRSSFALLAVFLIPCALPCTLPAQTLDPATTRIIARARPGLQPHRRQQLLGLRSGRVKRELKALGASVIEVPRLDAAETIAALQASGAFAFVEVDGLVQADAAVNDPYFSEQWGALRINAPQSWTMTMGSTAVVAVVDTGVERDHPDLQGQLLGGWDFVNNDADPSDDHGHGTAMAGIIVAAADNGIGIAGAAPHAAVMPIKVLDQTGFGFFSNVAAGVVYAADHGASVINLSLSAGSESPTLQAAVDYARARDVVVVASAGNNGGTQPTYPAAAAGAVGVMATDTANRRAWFSNYGPWVSLAAPGVNIYTTLYGGSYTSVLGTSPAAALASAAFALLRAAHPFLSADQAVSVMTSNAGDLGSPGFDVEFGHGLVDAYAALVPRSSTVADRSRPSATLITPQNGSLVDGLVPIDVAVQDNVGVTRVDLEIDGAVHASTDVRPFGFAWDTSGLLPGIHTLRAAARDAAGNRGRSAPVRVYVTPGEGLLVLRAKIRPGSGDGDGALRMKALVRLPQGVSFDSRADALTVSLASASDTALSVQIAGGAMESTRGAARYAASLHPASGGELRVELKPNASGGTYTLLLVGRKLSLANTSAQMQLTLEIGGATVWQPLALRPSRGDLLIP